MRARHGEGIKVDAATSASPQKAWRRPEVSGTPTKPVGASLTFQVYADLWLKDRKTKGRELRATTRRQHRMLLDKFSCPTFGDERIDRISTEDVNAWSDARAPGREAIRAQSYSLLRTIFASAASERPTPLIPDNPTHIRGDTKRLQHMQPASREEPRIIVEELPDRHKLMALLADWCAIAVW